MVSREFLPLCDCIRTNHRSDRLHLHPITATYKLRPHLGYIDVLSQKTRRKPSDDADSDPEINEDEEDAKLKPKKDKKDAREVHVSARKTDGFSSSMSDMRREMLKSMAAEESEEWLPINYCDEVPFSESISSFYVPYPFVERFHQGTRTSCGAQQYYT